MNLTFDTEQVETGYVIGNDGVKWATYEPGRTRAYLWGVRVPVWLARRFLRWL